MAREIIRNMNQEIINYINSQHIGILAVEMLDGAPHAATIHFAFSDQTGEVYIMTERKYRKCEPIIQNGQARASFVTGTSEEEMKTVQMDGVVKFADKENYQLYFDKFPEKEKWFKEPEVVILAFTPTWWRFTDMKAEGGKKIISSED